MVLQTPGGVVAGDSWSMVPTFPTNFYVTGIVVLESGALVVGVGMST